MLLLDDATHKQFHWTYEAMRPLVRKQNHALISKRKKSAKTSVEKSTDGRGCTQSCRSLSILSFSSI